MGENRIFSHNLRIEYLYLHYIILYSSTYLILHKLLRQEFICELLGIRIIRNLTKIIEEKYLCSFMYIYTIFIPWNNSEYNFDNSNDK